MIYSMTMKPIYIIRGKVRKGKQRGRILGFPTINISLHKNIPEGIYISQVLVSDTCYQAASFIGSAKTFGEKEYKLESFLLDFDKNLYGRWVTVSLYKRIRGNKKFASVNNLIRQMERDVSEVRTYFK